MESKLDKFCKKAFGQLPPRDTRTQWVRAGRARGRREGFFMAIKVMENEMRNLTDLRAAGAQQCRATLYEFAKLCTEEE